MKNILCLILLCTSCFAGICKDQKNCDELGRTRILASYEKVLLLQYQFEQARIALSKQLEEYNKTITEVKNTENQPEGATYDVDVPTDNVSVKIPPKPEQPINAPLGDKK